MCKLSKHIQILTTFIVLAMLYAFTGCDNSTVVESPTTLLKPNFDAENLLGPGNSRAFSINNSGTITGSAVNEGKNVVFALKNNRLWYSEEEVLPLTLPVIKFSINEPGDVGGCKLSGTELIPMLWRNEQAYELQRLSGFQFGEVYDINNGGLMVGECWNGTFTTATSMRAVVFSLEGAPIDLGTLGGQRAAAVAVNDLGHIVGGSQTETGQDRAFLFKDGVMQNLGTLGGTFSNANGINNRDEGCGKDGK